MRKWLRRIAILLLILLIAAVGVAGWFLLIDGRAPARRPDLVNVPVDVPPPSPGYPTQNALFLGYLMGWVEPIDPLKEGGLGGDMDRLLRDVPVPEEVVMHRDIPYSNATSPPLMLDLFYPANIGEAAPAIIFIHGGGWSSGQRSDYTYYGIQFAQAGYVVASISYRLKGVAPFPAAVEDAKCAVRWMRANAGQLHVDPERIAVAGGSAGGHLSMMVGYSPEVAEWNSTGGYDGVSSSVAAVVDLYGPTDLTTKLGQESELVADFLKTTYAERPDLYEQASPITFVDKDDPPTLIIQGTIDSIVPVEQSDLLAEKFQKIGKTYWYDRIDGWIHTLDVAKQNSERCIALMKAFFAEFMGPAPVPAAPVPTPLDLTKDLARATSADVAPLPPAEIVAHAMETAPPYPKGYATPAELQAALAQNRHALLTGADVEVGEGVVIDKDIPYNNAGMHLDLYRRAQWETPMPALVFIHGGAWEGGDKEYYTYWAARYASKGYVCAAVQYRFSQQAPYPAAVDDCRDAVRWLTAHASEYGVDADRMGVVGQSAGGHLALMVAYGDGGDDTGVKAVVAYYAPTDLASESLRDYEVVTHFLGGSFQENEARFHEASPISHVDSADPPTLLLHGTIDGIVPIAQADILAAHLAENGVPAFLLKLEGWDHAFEVVRDVNTHCMHVQDAFLEAYL